MSLHSKYAYDNALYNNLVKLKNQNANVNDKLNVKIKAIENVLSIATKDAFDSEKEFNDFICEQESSINKLKEKLVGKGQETLLEKCLKTSVVKNLDVVQDPKSCTSDDILQFYDTMIKELGITSIDRANERAIVKEKNEAFEEMIDSMNLDVPYKKIDNCPHIITPEGREELPSESFDVYIVRFPLKVPFPQGELMIYKRDRDTHRKVSKLNNLTRDKFSANMGNFEVKPAVKAWSNVIPTDVKNLRDIMKEKERESDNENESEKITRVEKEEPKNKPKRKNKKEAVKEAHKANLQMWSGFGGDKSKENVKKTEVEVKEAPKKKVTPKKKESPKKRKKKEKKVTSADGWTTVY